MKTKEKSRETLRKSGKIREFDRIKKVGTLIKWGKDGRNLSLSPSVYTPLLAQWEDPFHSFTGDFFFLSIFCFLSVRAPPPSHAMPRRPLAHARLSVAPSHAWTSQDCLCLSSGTATFSLRFILTVRSHWPNANVKCCKRGRAGNRFQGVVHMKHRPCSDSALVNRTIHVYNEWWR